MRSQFGQRLVSVNGEMMVIDHNGELSHYFDPDSDLNRETPPRTKQSHPYSYDPFTVFGGPNERTNGSVYTDRMAQWDREKYTAIGRQIFGNGQWFGEYLDAVKVQEFMRQYLGIPKLELTRVVEYCDHSSGYPTWRVDYFDPSKKTKNG